MNRPAKAQEPSMDEILSSIRRIIADDDAAKAQTGHAPPGPSEPAPPAMPAPPAAAPRSGSIAASGLRPPFSVRPPVTNPGGSPQESAQRREEDSLSGSTRFEPSTGRDYAPRSSGHDHEAPAAARPSTPAAANAGFPPAPNYAAAGNHQPASSHYQPAPSYHPAASAPAPLHPEPQPPMFRDSGGQAMEPAALRTHDEPRRQIVQHAVEQALLSGTTSAAVDSAFGMLTNKPPAQMPIAQMPIAQGARSIEELVQDMLRPMLKDWLEDNLPSLVERLVRAEIERVSRGR
jgi:cell pole-organizing protein PopZ